MESNDGKTSFVPSVPEPLFSEVELASVLDRAPESSREEPGDGLPRPDFTWGQQRLWRRTSVLARYREEVAYRA